MFFKAGFNYWILFSSVLLISGSILKYAEAKQSKRAKKYGCVLPEEPMYGMFVFNDAKKSLRYECYDGFYLTTIRQRDRKCRNGRWTGTALDCVYLRSFKLRCPKLKDPENGRVIVEGIEANNRAHFMCDEGYHIEGSSMITCQGGRYWDGIFPICRSHQTALDVAMNFKDKVVHTLSTATAQSESGVQARLSAGKNGLDILLLVDTSSSIGNKSLSIAKGFMCRLVEIFGVSSDPKGGGNGTAFALLTFSSVANIVFSYDSQNARSKNQVKQLINGIQNTGGGTNLEEALIGVVNENIVRIADRKDSTKAVFIITDAEDATSGLMNKERLDTIATIADEIKSDGEIFAIGVGNSVDKTLIGEIASDPYYEHVFYLEKFDDLSYIGDVISEKNLDYGQCGVSGDTATSQGTRISKKGALPWLGWLTVFGKDGSTWTCGGALLCDRWFMTTATCVTTLDNGTLVVANTSQIHLTLSDAKLYENDNTETYPVIHDVLVHDNYTGEKIEGTEVHEYDIALLDLGENETDRPVLQKYLRPLCIPSDNESIALANIMIESIMAFPETQTGYTAGWGHAPDNNRYTKTTNNKLSQMEQAVTKAKICRKVFPDLDKDKFFCVGEGYGVSEACKGDIGGPYMVRMQNKLFSGLGLALHTRNCDKPSEFSLFLNLQHPSITEWVTPLLDGCNRYKTVYDLGKQKPKPSGNEKKNYCDPM